MAAAGETRQQQLFRRWFDYQTSPNTITTATDVRWSGRNTTMDVKEITATSRICPQLNIV